MKCKIFIVEDNELTRTGLKVILNQIEDFEVLGEAGNGNDALTNLPTSDADLVLVDIGLPGMNGIELVRELKERNEHIKILMFTSHDDDHDMFESFSAGADGYVVKHEFGKVRLELAIRSVLDGKCWIDPGIARRVLKFAARHKQFSPVALVTDPLTLEEEAILSGAGCSNGVCAVEPAFLKRLQRFARRSS